MCKILKPSVVAVVLLFLISGYALFIQPLIGLADNGDFVRIMIPNDIKHEAQRNVNDYFGYFNHRYDRLQYYNDAGKSIISTHSLVIKTAMILDDLFTNDIKFDIRFLAAINLFVLALGIYWIVEVIEKKADNRGVKYFLALMAVVVFGDIGYTSYFNSFYGEAVAYSFFLLSISALLKFSLDSGNKKRYLLVYFAASIMFIGSKNQYALNGVLAFVLLVTVAFFKVRNTKKVIAAVLGLVLIITSALLYSTIDENIRLVNKYHMMTRGVMLFEPDVGEVTKRIGINEQFAMLSETIYFDRTPIIDPKDEILLNDFYPSYSLTSVLLYYMSNPKAFSKIMEFGWKNSFSIRPEVLGNYTRDSGREYGERTKFFTLWSYLKDNYIPHSSNFAYFFLIICFALAVNRMIAYNRNGVEQTVYFSEIVMLYVLLTGLSQIMISFIGSGDTDLKKHLFLTTVCLDILFYYHFAYAVTLVWKSAVPECEAKEVA